MPLTKEQQRANAETARDGIKKHKSYRMALIDARLDALRLAHKRIKDALESPDKTYSRDATDAMSEILKDAREMLGKPMKRPGRAGVSVPKDDYAEAMKVLANE